jgi:hypothetical protein
LDKTLREAFEEAGRDEAGVRTRREVNEAVAAAFRAGGQLLWVGGAMFGPDRAEKESPFDFGSDATVGLAAVLQIPGELVSGAVTLLAEDNRYAAAALLRQLVEVEYLAWAFAEDEEEAKTWMRSSKEERQQLWQPRHLRKRAGGRFRGSDYGQHCGRGGHPSPEGLTLLPDHSAPEVSAPIWWCDMAMHGLSVWKYTLEAADKLNETPALTSLDEAGALSKAEERWRSEDPLIALLDAAREALAN